MKGAHFKMSTLSDLVQAQVRILPHPEVFIHHLLLDSRTRSNPNNSLFIALAGANHDGHQFIADLYQRGHRNFLVNNSFLDATRYPDANFIGVDDTLLALQQISAAHRKLLPGKVIGITGSNGKTVVKEWLYQLLRSKYTLTRSPKSYNSQVGVPLSVWQLQTNDAFGIVEAGISLPGEMERLEAIVQPDFGIFTTIGAAHGENFPSQLVKAQEKAKLFKHCQQIIFCADYPEIEVALSDHLPERLVTWSKHKPATLQITNTERGSTSSTLQGLYKDRKVSIQVPFVDQASLENVTHCWLFLLDLGWDDAAIQKQIEGLQPVTMRLEVVEGINHSTIINDVYSADVDSLAIALDFMDQQKQHQSKGVVLSDIVQSGEDLTALYQAVAQVLDRHQIEFMVGVGPEISAHQHLFPANATFYPSTEAFLKENTEPKFKEALILLKGARKFRFERINQHWQQQEHHTVLEVNLSAIEANLNYFRQKLQAQTRVMVMVKAFSYGSGSHDIANLLEFNLVDYLGVAYADEGLALRQAGISLPIMVMNPTAHAFPKMIANNLEPEINTLADLRRFVEALEAAGKTDYPIHLNLDTGMHRLGFEAQHLVELVKELQAQKACKVVSVFSHLASSDMPEHDAFSISQFEAFEGFAQTLETALGYSILKHMLNSAGIQRFPEKQYDMVRIGIGLHGIAVTPEDQKALQQTSTLRTVITQLKAVPPQQSIGYARAAVAERETIIATLQIGYADGLNRRLSNGVGKVLIHGAFAPIVGKVCMDMCMVDVTDIPCQAGDQAIIFGADYPVTELAVQLDTIPYEVLTSVSHRVKRIYLRD